MRESAVASGRASLGCPSWRHPPCHPTCICPHLQPNATIIPVTAGAIGAHPRAFKGVSCSFGVATNVAWRRYSGIILYEITWLNFHIQSWVVCPRDPSRTTIFYSPNCISPWDTSAHLDNSPPSAPFAPHPHNRPRILKELLMKWDFRSAFDRLMDDFFLPTPT